MLVFTQRPQQRIFQRPAGFQPRVQSLRCHAVLLRPFAKVLGFTLIAQQAIASAIHGLFLAGSPATVFGRVASVIIFPVDRMFRCRPWTHVSQKYRERIEPFLAHMNAAAAIICVILSFLSVAAILKIAPSPIFGASVLFGGLAVFCFLLCNMLSTKTTATPGVAAFDVTCTGYKQSSAAALALPL